MTRKEARMSDYYSIQSLKIDAEFKNLLAPLTEQEYEQLESNIKQQGCLEPLTIWNRIIIDGHNRYQICITNNIPFRTRNIHFASRNEALAWICANQLGRRNISEETKKYLIGKKYELEKTIGARNMTGCNQHSSKDNYLTSPTLPSSSHNKTAMEIGKEYNISHNTVYKYGIYAKTLDDIQKKSPAIAKRILSGNIKISHENLVNLSKLSTEELNNLLNCLNGETEGQISYSNMRHELQWKPLPKHQKKRDEIQQAEIPIKQLPKYDPDAEISSLSLTIPSWISSMNRTKNMTKFESTTTAARENLINQLYNLQNTIDTILVLVKEGNI